MRGINFSALLWCLLIASCKSKPAGNEAQQIMPFKVSDTTGARQTVFLKDSVFDLAKCAVYFPYKNNLAEVPFDSGVFGQEVPNVVLDSVAVKAIYQDSANHYYNDAVGSGNQFYGYIDTFKNFNIVCMLTGMGDGGALFDLLTFTKQGKRIAGIEAAWLAGEENDWDYNEKAYLRGDGIKVEATNCHVVDSMNHIFCDTLRRFYRFKYDGEIIFVKGDTVLNPALDSIRKIETD